MPLFRSAEFEDRSRRGLYGDVIEEIDWSVGQLLDALRELELEKETLVIFTSDNGPWLTYDEQGGSAGLLRDGKGSTWEGGMREPTLAWWPGQIEPHSISREVASTMDLFATIHRLAGLEMPSDRVMDSYDLTPVLRGTGSSERELLFYYRGYHLMAVRKGPWKAHFITQDAYGPGSREPVEHDPPLLFNLDVNPGEDDDQNLAEKHPEVIAEIQSDVEAHREQLDPPPSQLERTE